MATNPKTKQIIAQRAAKQQATLDAIIAQAKNAGRSAEDANIVAWIAKAESNIGLNVKGQGTISGTYQFSDGTWTDRKNRYSKLDEFKDFDWEANRNTTEGQEKVVLADSKRYAEEFNNGNGLVADWDRNGSLGKMTAKEAMASYDIPWTLENYVYLRHNTDIREVKMVELQRLLDRDGWYAKAEKAVETAYGKQITDPYDNPSLSPLIKKLADAVHLNIEGMTNQEALGWIRERYSRMNKTNPKGVAYLLKCLSGYNKLETSKLWQYWNNIRSSFTTATTTTSPIALDLDGDGVETTGVTAGAYFDHDANGFAEQTGWAGADDGLLAMDRDGNGTIDSGKELFGDQTILSSGQKASNGFQALADLDDNKDGKIDTNDSAYSQLKVWQDIDGDGYSSEDELLSLSDAGVASINTGYTDANITDANGNTIKQDGSFTKSDGTTGAASDVYFQVDNTNTIANEWLDVPEDIAALPDLQGYGNVYDLQQAMAREALSGQQSAVSLKSLVEQFMNETNASVRHDLVIQILYKWAGVENVDPLSRAARIIYGNAIKNHAMKHLSTWTGAIYKKMWFNTARGNEMLKLAA